VKINVLVPRTISAITEPSRVPQLMRSHNPRFRPAPSDLRPRFVSPSHYVPFSLCSHAASFWGRCQVQRFRPVQKLANVANVSGTSMLRKTRTIDLAPTRCTETSETSRTRPGKPLRPPLPRRLVPPSAQLSGHQSLHRPWISATSLSTKVGRLCPMSPMLNIRRDFVPRIVQGARGPPFPNGAQTDPVESSLGEHISL
jgi:hypothetical protein